MAYGSLLGARCCFAGTHTVGRSMLGGVGGSHYNYATGWQWVCMGMGHTPAAGEGVIIF